MSDFTKYIALGDSVSIDLYPALDAGATEVAVALERSGEAGAIAPLGAASLFHRNDAERWPDDVANDLVTFYPGIEFVNLAMDSASIGDVFGEQLSQVEDTDQPVLLTLTIGTNDLLSATANKPKRPLLERITSDIAEAYDFLVDALRTRFPNGMLVVNTIYDPSDGTGALRGRGDNRDALPADVLDRMNDHIRALAVGTPRVLLADLHAHFLGHGASAAEKDRWYWRRSPLEPSAVGASEIRRVWLETIGCTT